MDRASRPRVRVHGAPSRGILIRDRRVVVVYSRGEVRETRKKVSTRLDFPRLVLRAVARARVRRRGGTNEEGRERIIPLSLRPLLSSVIALEGTPERRRTLLTIHIPDDLRAGEITR